MAESESNAPEGDASKPKTSAVIDLTIDFLEAVFGLESDIIHCPRKNRSPGDVQVLLQTIEVKKRGIDPETYDRNFVEIFVDTTARRKPSHHDGLRRTASYLGMGMADLAKSAYWDHREGGRPKLARVGSLSHVEASLASIAGSAFTIYVNPDPAKTWLYCYSRDFLLDAARKLVVDGAMRRGMGQANPDAFAVLAPISPARWRRVEGAWHYHGSHPRLEQKDVEARIKQGLLAGDGGARGRR